MNFEVLNNRIPARRLPDDQTAPRRALFEMFHDLEELRERRAALADALDEDELEKLDKQIKLYELTLE